MSHHVGCRESSEIIPNLQYPVKWNCSHISLTCHIGTDDLFSLIQIPLQRAYTRLNLCSTFHIIHTHLNVRQLSTVFTPASLAYTLPSVPLQLLNAFQSTSLLLSLLLVQLMGLPVIQPVPLLAAYDLLVLILSACPRWTTRYGECDPRGFFIQMESCGHSCTTTPKATRSSRCVSIFSTIMQAVSLYVCQQHFRAHFREISHTGWK